MDNGGPAFPLDLKVGEDHMWAHGMNLRDYFAAKAMQSMIISCRTMDNLDLVGCAYDYADNMITQRLIDKP